MENINELLTASLQGGVFAAIALAFLGGLLTSATPCVYPMIPITISVIGGNSGSRRFSGFINSVIYVAGLALVYGGLGVLAAATGSLFGEISTHPWGYFLVANLCLFFAAWMMGWVNLPQLGFMASPGTNTSLGKGKILLAGMASGLVAGPCTAPVLATLLTFAATSGELLYGGLLLFVFAFGLGTLLILIGTFSSLAARIPKSGAWMLWTERLLALLMLGAAEYFFIQMGMLLF
ncbi:cytochrome c biogenesis protein CcdA [Thalassomonas sp. RHCl1]|uniref:cytochrome c biogenesis protein CcdA n=1 Tax=Thalassomonas sp. RHCl1 TaxID=2995320 RepID=UPI00248BCE07|nr:cytochrome c biogenesis protein CcdA [Thalassomonas sp. RHCl1]